MAIIYHAAVKTARMTATRDHLAGGTLEIQAASDAVLAVFTIADPGGSVSGDTWTIEYEDSATVGTSAASTGTNATKARVKDSGGTVKVSGLTVGAVDSGADIELDNVNIAEDQSVTLTTSTIQHAPDPA